jgi:DnaK suppressor protein
MDTETARALLSRERERVETALRRLDPAERDREAEAPTASDAGPDVVQTGLDQADAESLQDELAAIERAEQRLAEGTYGVSVVSGEPIPDARLEAMPWAERTVEEQSRFER